MAASAAVHAFPIKRATTCNGHPELCNRSFGNVTFIGAHDSYAIDKLGINPTTNQNIDLTTQLNLGVRLLQVQGHLKDGHVQLCHTNCVLQDGGSFADYLKTVVAWLKDNPNEVLTLVATNGADSLDVAEFWDPDFKSSGMDQFVFTPPKPIMNRDEWPTLGSMIDSGKRVVVFMDFHSDTSKVPYILPEFDNMWETPFDVTDSSFPCKVDRGTAPNKLNMINHFLDVDIFGILIPDRLNAGTTNSVDSILKDANGCVGLAGGVLPSHVLLDYVDKGQAIEAGNKLNGF
jgi:hypothetical protein